MKKLCSKCGQPGEFYKDSRASDGLQSQCKRCMNAASVERNRKNQERAREYKRRSQARQAEDPAWRAKRNARERERQRNQRPEVKAAHQAVRKAVKIGALVKPTSCERCGKPTVRLHGHHADYVKQLEVEWLCPSCHQDHHINNNSRHPQERKYDGP